MSATFQPDDSPPAKSTSGLKVVLIVLAVLAVLALLVCGGIFGLGYFAWNRTQEVVNEDFKEQLEGNPVLEQEIGELQSVNVSFMETARRQEEGAATPRMVMRVQGTEGEGTVVATVPQDGRNRITAATLETEDGRTVELPIEEDDTSLQETDIDAGEPVGEPVDEGQPVDEEAEDVTEAPVDDETEEPADAEAETSAPL